LFFFFFFFFSFSFNRFLRDFDELYPTPISLSSVAGVATASAASAPQDQHAAPKLMEEDHGNLDALKKTYRNISASMESLEWELKNFISLSPAEHQALTVKLNERVTDLTNLRKSAGQLLSTILLIPPQFEMWKWLLTHVEQALQQLQVYKKELDAVFHNKYPAQGFGSLVITEQPFPDVVKQKEKKRSKGHAGHHEGHLEVGVSLIHLGGVMCGVSLF
jgi:hypothetical protein